MPKSTGQSLGASNQTSRTQASLLGTKHYATRLVGGVGSPALTAALRSRGRQHQGQGYLPSQMNETMHSGRVRGARVQSEGPQDVPNRGHHRSDSHPLTVCRVSRPGRLPLFPGNQNQNHHSGRADELSLRLDLQTATMLMVRPSLAYGRQLVSAANHHRYR